MKKTLAAVAVLGAFAGSALAAAVTLYGKVDLGFGYANTNTDTVTFSGEDVADLAFGVSNAKTDSWAMESGQNSGSRWGIKGSEKISDGLTVGFQLENGFTADDGKLGQGSRLFGREARLYVTTDFGEVAMGRMGGLDSGLGSYNLMGDTAVFGTDWGEIVGDMTQIYRGVSGRMDNTITYKSPAFAGMNAYAQVSLDPASAGDEASSDTDRYYALGLKGKWDALSAAMVVSTTDYARTFAKDTDEDNSLVVTGGVAYNFGFMKTSFGAQYYDNVKGVPFAYELDSEDKDLNAAFAKVMANVMTKGYGAMLGATAPVAGGTLSASIGYGEFEWTENSVVEGDVINFGLGYQYPLSKRTYLYTAAGYNKVVVEAEGLEAEAKTTEVIAGIVHNF